MSTIWLWLVAFVSFSGGIAGDTVGEVPLNDLFLKNAAPISKENRTARWTQTETCSSVSDHQFCVFSNEAFNAGEGMAMITTEDVAARLAESQMWEPSEDDQFITHLGHIDRRYHDEEIPGKGVGLVADRIIRRGGLIMNRKPSLIADERMINNVQAVEELFPAAFSSLPSIHQKAYLNLSTHIPVDSPTDQIRGIMLSNSFNIQLKGDDDQEQTLCVTFLEVSRINHDCRPNSNYYFDYATFSHRIYANRDIYPGEEITITYVEEKRQEKLKSVWGFACTCNHCSAPPHIARESDSRLDQVALLRQEVEDYARTDASSPKQAELMLELFELEDVRVKIHLAYFHAAVQWNSVGDSMTAMKFARRAIDHGLISIGPEQWIIKDMQELAERPLDHWSWGARERGWWRVKPTSEED